MTSTNIIKIKLDCESCGAPVSHILKDYDDEYGHIYQCDYCGTRYYIKDEQLEKYYEPKESYEPRTDYIIASSSTTTLDTGWGIETIIKIVVGFMIAAILFPIALQQVDSTPNQNWNPQITSGFQVLAPVIIIGTIIYGFWKMLKP